MGVVITARGSFKGSVTRKDWEEYAMVVSRALKEYGVRHNHWDDFMFDEIIKVRVN